MEQTNPMDLPENTCKTIEFTRSYMDYSPGDRRRAPHAFAEAMITSGRAREVKKVKRVGRPRGSKSRDAKSTISV